MTAIETIIKDAIDGGWNPKPLYYVPRWKTLSNNGITLSGGEGDTERYTTHQLLLDPTFWQAVGKTRDWDFQYSCSNPEHINPKAICPDCEFEQEDTWKEYWLEFINHLADGLTTEEALAKLTTWNP